MTKRFAHFLLFLLTAITAGAQTFTPLPNDSVEGTYQINDWASDFIYIRNNSVSSVNLSYQTIANTMTPVGWDVVLCTNNACFPYVPVSGTLGAVASGDSAYFHVQCGFMGIAGTNQIRVRIYETNNPSNADTITIVYHALVTIGFADNSTVTENLSQNYPNPFSGITTIAYDLHGANGDLMITDLTGKVVSVYPLNIPKGQISIGNLLPGTYFYMLRSEDGILAQRIMVVQ
jgi:hypothetical protein